MHAFISKLLFPTFIQGSCPNEQFRCRDGNNCIDSSWVCNGEKDCRDGSDERFCDPCSYEQFRCADKNHCVTFRAVCDGNQDCPDGSDERNCGIPVSARFKQSNRASDYLSLGDYVLDVPGIASVKAKLISWIKQRRKSDSTVDKWGSQLPRVAVALYLANESIFSPENTIGQEISYELTIQLLQHFSMKKSLTSEELALYIHAMLVACMDPRDFYGENLVQELRKRTEANDNYTDPFQILVLCNAGDKMTTRDVDRVVAAYDSQHRPFLTETQALASLALTCLSKKSNIMRDDGILRDMLKGLQWHNFGNITVDNLKITALVLQNLMRDCLIQYINLKWALQSLFDNVNRNVTLLNAYYTLPVLAGKNLLNVNSIHCRATPETEADALKKALNVNGETIYVHFSVWPADKRLATTLILKMHPNNSIYDVIETAAKIDRTQNIKYKVVKGKPFVTSVWGIKDDPERGTFWFVHIRNLNTDGELELMEQSPVDLKVRADQEVILWYKPTPQSSPLRGPISMKSN
ncbi:gastric intrinsic factor [Trichonephila inaurata madagascariensis]|uniref:Gastric intrinsic factor n=1 Tax=Trichonephila inaurata madagascariensis TaxID=2747483 RepID=A0A8X7CM66_9ARAC|nr:gastric intrinsic factor [Trichonephila inaurata madagascariensis]